VSGEPLRPDPDRLLEAVEREAERARLGKLRIFFGASAGVGKTYSMLREGHRLKAIGRDVVIGLVETHNRPETIAQIGDLEVVPRLEKVHGGVTLHEIDVAGVLARRPEIALVDELAHSNGPGSAREKRWEDVQILLDAGIDVISTLNIQHLESLNDVVESITGVRVRETVPDHVLRQADDIQLVDLPADSLIERMEDGHIYPATQAAQALQHFFRPGNLNALRELSLRHIASGVDDRLEHYMREHAIPDIWPAAERVLVWLPPGPDAGTILRKAFRMASGLRGELVAAIPTHDGDAQTIERLVRLAEDMGGTVYKVSDGAGAEQIIAAVRAQNAQILVISHVPVRSWRDRIGKSLTDTLYEALENVDIYLVEGVRKPQ